VAFLRASCQRNEKFDICKSDKSNKKVGVSLSNIAEWKERRKDILPTGDTIGEVETSPL
jgi:hypothetical protein